MFQLFQTAHNYIVRSVAAKNLMELSQKGTKLSDYDKCLIADVIIDAEMHGDTLHM